MSARRLKTGATLLCGLAVFTIRLPFASGQSGPEGLGGPAASEAECGVLAPPPGETLDIIFVIDGSGSEVERLRAFIRYQPELLEEHADFIKLYVSHLGQRSHKLSRTRKENSPGNVLDSKVEQVIKAGIDKGMFRPVDPAIAAKAISSTLETIAFETAGLVDKAGLTDIFRKVEQLFIDGLLMPGGVRQ